MKPAMELHRQRIPRRLLWLDALGAVLVAAGVLELLQAGPRLLPEVLRFRGFAIALVLIGSAAMLAVPIWLLRQHRRRQRNPAHGEQNHES